MGVHARAECVGALVVAVSLGAAAPRPRRPTALQWPRPAPGAAAGELVVTGEPQRERGSYPLATSVSDYSR